MRTCPESRSASHSIWREEIEQEIFENGGSTNVTSDTCVSRSLPFYELLYEVCWLCTTFNLSVELLCAIKPHLRRLTTVPPEKGGLFLLVDKPGTIPTSKSGFELAVISQTFDVVLMALFP